MSEPAPSSPLALQPISENQFSLTITDNVSTGPREGRFLYGGSALALGMTAMESAIGGMCRRAMVQFIRPAPVGSELTISVHEASKGKSVSQASIDGRVNEEIVFSGNGTLQALPNKSEEDFEMQWPTISEVPAPNQCDEIIAHDDAHEDIHSLFELRIAGGRFGIFSRAQVRTDGQVFVWCRPRISMSATDQLALLADFLPSMTSNAVNGRAGGRSLDNWLHLVQRKETEWMLVSGKMASIFGGIGQGTVNIFSDDGALLATGGQTFRIFILPG